MKELMHGIVFVGLFTIPFIPLFVADSMFFPFITGKNFAFRIIIEIIFGAWVILALLDSQYRPRFSWIAVSGAAFIVVMLFANLFGEYVPKSFMSNFERMDGYITLVHFYLFFIVLGSMIRDQKMWGYYLHTSLAVALYVGLYGLAQFTGLIEGGRTRVESTLGNAAYMAVYMLFHIFFLLFVALRSKGWFKWVLYGIWFLVFVYILLQTGTRGTFLGFVGGSFISVLYIAFFSRRYPNLRKVAAGGFIALTLFSVLFFVVKDSQFIQDSQTLSRFANISSKDLVVRSVIWSMALEGIKERPILGWGQGNFNYIFNKEFNPSLHSAEAWFDRVHNIILDWLVAGGILGLLSYLSIFFASMYYLFWRPLFRKDESFTVPERAVLIGILAGYFAHNLVVFDNIVSYMFFAILLALIHSRVSEDWPKVKEFVVDRQVVQKVVLPIVIIFTAGTVYFANIPGILASQDMIDALISRNPEERLKEFESALSRNSFANQEIVEQLAQQAIAMARDPNLSNDIKNQYVARAENELLNLAIDKPGDARVHVFISNFYRSIGALDKAEKQAEIARNLTPRKQTVIIEQGVIAFQMGQYKTAQDFFKIAYELDLGFREPRNLYAMMFYYTGEAGRVREIITEEYWESFALNDFALTSADRAGARRDLIDMYVVRIEQDPTNAQHRASLAFIHYLEGDITTSIEILEKAVADIPTFETAGNCYMGNLKAGKQPEQGCSGEVPTQNGPVQNAPVQNEPKQN